MSEYVVGNFELHGIAHIIGMLGWDNFFLVATAHMNALDRQTNAENNALHDEICNIFAITNLMELLGYVIILYWALTLMPLPSPLDLASPKITPLGLLDEDYSYV